VSYNNHLYKKEALISAHPELFLTKADAPKNQTTFGTAFPKAAYKGDIFIRVDMLPNRVFKFDGKSWIEINKETSDTYLYEKEYIKYLIDKIDIGEYDLDLLSDAEKYQIEEYLRNEE